MIKAYNNSAFGRFVRERGLSGSALKMIAMLSMLIDHMGVVLLYDQNHLKEYAICRIIGRLAFPIFCFLISEGMEHTSSMIKYFLRMVIMAILCQVPYSFVLKGELLQFDKLNIFFTLAISMFPGIFYRYSNENFKIPAMIIGAALSMVVAYLVGPEYGYRGVGLIVLMYLFRQFKPFSLLLAAVYMVYIWRGSPTQLLGTFSVVIMLFYSGHRGFIRSKAAEISCYIFYPFHLLMLYGIKLLIN